MADRPILFSSSMVRALLAGTKTQTRRLLSLRGHKSFSEFGPSDTPGYDWHFRDAEKRWHDLRDAELKARLRIAVGDRLYVREAWRVPAQEDRVAPRNLARQIIGYEADCSAGAISATGKLRRGIHMPRWASRITLHVTDVRVQGLQEISEEDAQAEGVERLNQHVAFPIFRDYGALPKSGPGALPSARSSYATLWDSINGAGSWEANPWVCAISFRCIPKNIDTLQSTEEQE